MPSSRNSQTPVFLTGSTALCIMRAALACGHAMPASSAWRPDASAPVQADVERAAQRVQAELPGFELQHPVHVLVGGDMKCRPGSMHVSHACTTQLPRGAFWRLAPGVYVATPQLCFVRAAAEKQLPNVALLELAFELCGTYATPRTAAVEETLYDAAPLCTSDELRSYAARCTGVSGARKAERLLRYAADGSASPRETKLALLLGLPQMRGGVGLGIPQMNYGVTASREASLIAGRTSFRCDLCWPDAKLDVEYQSRFAHSNERSRIDDSRRANALRAMGWDVVAVTNDELDSVTATDVIIRTLARALGKRIRVRVSDYRQRQLALRLELGLPIGSWSVH